MQWIKTPIDSMVATAVPTPFLKMRIAAPTTDILSKESNVILPLKIQLNISPSQLWESLLQKQQHTPAANERQEWQRSWACAEDNTQIGLLNNQITPQSENEKQTPTHSE